MQNKYWANEQWNNLASPSNIGAATHGEFEAHEASLLMHKPAIDCTVFNKASVEGYASTAGTEVGDVVYEYYDDMTNPIVPTAVPNKYIITFSGVRPDVIVDETVDFVTWIDGPTTGVIVSVDTQTITLTCSDTLTDVDNALYELTLHSRVIDTYSHAEGAHTTASGYASHAEGRDTTASGYASHAEGRGTTASGAFSHAEGRDTTASRDGSHAEGLATLACRGTLYKITAFDNTAKTITLDKVSGLAVNGLLQIKVASAQFYTNFNYEGLKVTAINGLVVTLSTTETIDASWVYAVNKGYQQYPTHAEGVGTIASGPYSHAQNLSTIAQGRSQTVLGEYNIPQGDNINRLTTDYALIVGNGGSESSRNNAMTVNWAGDLWTAGSHTATQFKLSALNAVPASATAAGVAGEIRVTADYIYVCVATNTWKRTALTTW